MKKYRVLYADPPWPEAANMIAPAPEKSRGGARRHYSLMTLGDICAFDLPEMADDSFLFLWCPNRMVLDAHRVMQSWGFRFTGASFIWVKTQKNAPTEPVYGMGYWLRIAHEIILIGRRGKPKPKARNIRSVVLHPRGAHSEKPAIFHDIIEQFSDGPYVELFARRERAGWTTIGNEVP